MLHWFSWAKNHHSSTIPNPRSTFFFSHYPSSDILWWNSVISLLGSNNWKIKIDYQIDISRNPGQWMGMSHISGGPTRVCYHLLWSTTTSPGEGIIFSRWVYLHSYSLIQLSLFLLPKHEKWFFFLILIWGHAYWLLEGEGGRERNIDQLPLVPAPIRDWAYNLLVCGTTLQQTDQTVQGWKVYLF